MHAHTAEGPESGQVGAQGQISKVIGQRKPEGLPPYTWLKGPSHHAWLSSSLPPFLPASLSVLPSPVSLSLPSLLPFFLSLSLSAPPILVIRVSGNRFTNSALRESLQTPDSSVRASRTRPLSLYAPDAQNFNLSVTIANLCLFAFFLTSSSEPSLLLSTDHRLWFLLCILGFQTKACIWSCVFPKGLLALASSLWSALCLLPPLHECH